MTIKPLSRQRRWQLRKQAEGRCITCGGINPTSKTRCPRCYADIEFYNANFRKPITAEFLAGIIEAE